MAYQDFQGYESYPHGGYGYPVVASCNGTGCVHSGTCPVSHLPRIAAMQNGWGHSNPFIPFAERGNPYYTNAVHGPPSASPPGIPRSKDPCLFYQQNRCSKGDKCRFSHTVSNASELTSLSPSLHCKFFRQGSCRNGESCIYLHDVEGPSISSPPLADGSEDDEQPLELQILGLSESDDSSSTIKEVDLPPADESREDEVTSPVEKSSLRVPIISAGTAVFEPCAFHSTGRCVRGDSCVVQHCEPDGPIHSPSVSPLLADLKGNDEDWIQFSEHIVDRAPPHMCTFFTNGMCSMGESCPSEHDLYSSFFPMRPCQYFAEGACTTGDACPFVHDIRMHAAMQNAPLDSPNETPINEILNVPSSSRLCRYYSQGKCRKGTGCRFSHDVRDETPERDRESSRPTPMEDTAASWLVSTDDNPEWGVQEHVNRWTDDLPSANSTSEWLHTAASTPADWGADPYPGTTLTTGEDTDSGWLEDTDMNPAWNPDPQKASKWVTDFSSNGRLQGDIAADGASSPSSFVKDPLAEESWDLPWPDPVPAVERGKKAYCKYFGQGHCAKGDTCQFLHGKEEISVDRDPDFVKDTQVSHNNPTQQLEPLPELEAEHPSRFIYNSMVRFGSGAIPEQVVTSFDSSRLIVSNYPPGFDHNDLRLLAEPYGVVKDTTFRLWPEGVQACIQFDEYAQAAEARLNLNGMVLNQQVMRARLDSIGSVGGSIHEPQVEHQLKLVWDAPSVSAWAFYKNVGMAKVEAARLNGAIYDSREISAEYRKPAQTHSVPVRLSGLPLNVNREDLQEFCAGSSSVSLDSPNYREAQDDNIRACLAGFGPIKSFEVLPTDSSKLKMTAFVKFDGGKTAADAVKSLKGKSHHFLGKGCITAQPVFHFKYDCANCPLDVVRDELCRLRDSCSDSTIQCYDQVPPCVHIYGRRAKETVIMAKSVQSIIFGSELDCWDLYFDTKASEEALKRINSDPSFHIRPDKRRRILRIWGEREKAQKQVIRLLKQVQAKRHSLHLGSAMPALLHGGLKSLQDAFGASKVLLDVNTQTLTVLGDIKTEVESHLETITSSYSRGNGNCCHCFKDAADRTELACSHVYCTPCLLILLRPVPGIDFVPPRCIAEVVGPDDSTSRCLAAVPIPPQLSEADQAELFEASLLSFVRADSEFRFCISGCRVVYRIGIPGAILSCPECRIDLCACCAVPVHTGLTCQEYRALDDKMAVE
ncbi:hypothetical protein C8R43DRAFT_1000363 [Mycena crocata]|nr:hypothetical protein C8R43DRAFT_1000363 [Mycena crocata]